MENASKALTMAGGILLAIMIIGALILMFNQISDYQKSKVDSQKNSQTAQFNQDFLKYFDEKSINGTDIISLVNKVIDFNEKVGSGNYVDYEKKITLHIDITGFAQKYGVENKSKLFGNITLQDIKYSNHSFAKMISKFSNLEKKYTLITMEKLKSYSSSIRKAVNENGMPIKDAIKQLVGKEIEEFNNLDDIDKYDEYTKFKSSKFMPVGQPVYNGGQLVELSFEFSN